MTVRLTAAPGEPVTILDDDTGRGATLEYKPRHGGFWGLISCHDNREDALTAFRQLPSWCDRNHHHYRICCHHLDMGDQT